jgi:hypothetical protein
VGRSVFLSGAFAALHYDLFEVAKGEKSVSVSKISTPSARFSQLIAM